LRAHKRSEFLFRLAANAIPAVCAWALLSVLLSCESPQAISAFSDSAQKTLAGGPPLFNDIHDSCVRRETARPGLPILPLFVPPGSKNAPPKNPPGVDACARFSAEAQALDKVSDVLTAYFRGVQQLSAFNTSSVTAANQTAAESAAFAANLSLTQADSVGKLASLVTRVFTAGYQRSRLLESLRSADPHIVAITEGLDAVIGNYIDFLQEERQTVTARYQSVAGTDQPAMLLLLNRAYSGDLAAIDRRRDAAAAYREALQNIREGHHQVVLSAHHLSDKELNLALQPYTSKLDSLVSALQEK
jgi:hypothetical protein